MGDEICYKEWCMDVMHSGPSWEALIYRPNSPLHDVSVPHGNDRHAVIEKAKLLIDDRLAS
jgi:hypothetical protein